MSMRVTGEAVTETGACAAASARLPSLAPWAFRASDHGKVKDGLPAVLDAVLASDPGRPDRLARQAWRPGWVTVAVWLLPTALLMGVVGGVLADIAWFFSVMAAVTVGGAYAVLAYIAQEAVRGYGWLTADQMLAGLGLAETTPGPLILVLQFVGFLGGHGAGGIAYGVVASAMVLWVTFAPCFAWIFLGAPFVERLQGHRKLTGALAAVTAAVVGVVLNLALWFGLRVLFAEVREVRFGILALDMPVLGSLDPLALALAGLATVCMFWLRLGLVPTLGVTAAVGLVAELALG